MTFQINRTDYSHIQKLIKEFEPFTKMWETAAAFTTHHELWMTGKFLDLDAEAIQKEVLDSTKLLVKTEKQFSTREGCEKCVKICQLYRQKMDDFAPMLPMILALRNPGMRNRHWDNLSEELGFMVKPDNHFKLEMCIQLKLMDQIDSIEKVGELAGKEYTLETALTGMYSAWDGVLLEILDYR